MRFKSLGVTDITQGFTLMNISERFAHARNAAGIKILSDPSLDMKLGETTGFIKRGCNEQSIGVN